MSLIVVPGRGRIRSWEMELALPLDDRNRIPLQRNPKRKDGRGLERIRRHRVHAGTGEH